MVHFRSRLGWLLMLFPLAMVPEAAGQGPRTIKASLIGEKDLMDRLQDANREVDPLGTPSKLARSIGFFCEPLTLYPSLAAGMAESNTLESWEKVLGEYERFLQDPTDILVPLPPRNGLRTTAVASMQIRRLVRERLATLPPSLLEKYRLRVDPQAAKLFQAGRLNHDSAPLRKIVDEMFCSKSGEHALDLLGDLAFERGQFGEATSWWSQLALPLELRDGEVVESNPWPRFPQPTIDPAVPRAKQILARLFLGETAEAARDLAAFRSRHGQAKGFLAGRDGILADLLADLLAQARERRLFRPEPTWHTFAGSSARQHVVEQALSPRLWADGPTWRRPLPGTKEPRAAKLGSHPQPPIHPIIVDDQVILADASSVHAFNLLTGQPLWTYDLKAMGMPVTPVENLPVDMMPQFTLTASGGKLFVRLGKVSARHSGKDDTGPNHLVCLDLNPALGAPREQWPRRTIMGNVMIEGSPLVVEDRMYFAHTRVLGQRMLTAIICWDAATARQRWSRDVCESLESDATEPARGRHHLLTLTNGQLVYCTHNGAIVAVDPWSGRWLWGLRYPSRPRLLSDATYAPRSLAPCVFHENRLYVAPQDTDTLYCLDPVNGALLWERSGIDVVHLLGVSGPRLFFTTSSGLRAISAQNGTDELGWQQPAVGKLPSLGRGLLMGDWILWPTQDPRLPLRAVCQSDGSQEGVGGTFYEPSLLHRLIAGNMVYADGCLVVAGSDELAVYVSAGRLQKKLSQKNDGPHGAMPGPAEKLSPADEYRRALAAAEAGNDRQAAAILAGLGRHGPQWHRLARQTMVDVCKAGPICRASCLDLARVKAGGLDVNELVKLLHDARLEREFVLDEKQLPRSLAELVREQMQKSSKDVFEELAEKELARAAGQPTALAKMSGRFLGTRAALKALLELSRTEETARPAAAASALRALLLQPLEPEQRSQVQAGLKRVLAKLDSSDDAKAVPGLPLLRRWKSPGRNMLDLSPTEPTAQLFLTQTGGRVACRQSADGTELWSQETPFAVTWARVCAELVVIAGPDGAAGLLRDTGRLVWYFPSPDVASPRVQLQGDEPVILRDGAGLDGFRLAGDRLIVCFDQRRLICLDAGTGKLAWTKWAPAAEIRPLLDGGKFQPGLAVTPQRLLVFSNDGKRWLLDAATGRTVAEADWPTPAYPTPLLVDQGRKACLPQNDAVIALDLDTGREAWRFNYPWRSSLFGEPALLLETDRHLLAVFTLNYGQEVWRLDLANGKPAWHEPILLPARASQWCTCKSAQGQERCFYVLDNRLHCRALGDGKLLWQRPLPAGAARWQVRPLGKLGDAVLLGPDEPVVLPVLNLGGLNFRPLVDAMKPPKAEAGIWLLDLESGSPLQFLPSRTACVQVLFSPAGMVVSEQGQLCGFAGESGGKATP